MTAASSTASSETSEEEERHHAARLGMWVFLASEILLFAGLFALYGAYRAHDPSAFQESVHANDKLLGSINTAVLLTSSVLLATGVETLALEGRHKTARRCVLGTALLGFVFLVIKAVEYRAHFAEGVLPGHGTFWTLYFVTTGLHAIHVTIGIIVLLVLVARLSREHAHRLELGALYWHLVDVVWIFVWPLYYLA
jgi:cytochrome c oxidase subunit 3